MFKVLAFAGVAALSVSISQAGAQPMMSKDFVSTAGASDKFEIGEAKLVMARGHSAKIKKFARMMVHDHTQSTMKIKAAATKVMGHAPPPPHLSDDQMKMMADLKAAHGADFDRTYIQQQIPAHQQALQLMQNYASNGDAPPLKHAATEITPVVQHHLDMLNDMQSHMQ